MGAMTWLKHAWNLFKDTKPEERIQYSEVVSYGSRPDRTRLRFNNERSILASIFTRIAIDVSRIDIRHVRLDENDRYVKDIKSNLNDCLTVEANIDQAAEHFKRDIVLTLCDTGIAPIVPIDTTLDPDLGSFDIKTMRVGEVIAWEPRQIRVRVYNEAVGRRDDITVEKRTTAIVENPFYAVMNEPNSTLKRLTHKLSLLDAVDDQVSSGKLDLIIQLPYVVRSETRKQQANQRRLDIEDQLKNGKYGIAYTDGTEKITQLNRPAENNLLKQVEYLMNLLYTQLGLTPEVMNGTADEAAMLNYHNRTVQPIVTAIVQAMHRSFLTKTARTQGQAIKAFRNPFDNVPVKDFAEISDKMTRNEILSSNEIRGYMGIPPSTDPKADKLINSNMPQPVESDILSTNGAEEDDAVQSTLDSFDSDLSDMLTELQNATV
jgi:hypothetical protein